MGRNNKDRKNESEKIKKMEKNEIKKVGKCDETKENI